MPSQYPIIFTDEQRAWLDRTYLFSDAPSMAAIIKRAIKAEYPAFPYVEDPDDHYHKIWSSRSTSKRAAKNKKTNVKVD